jgi:dienelactone hydrolase
MLVTEGKNSGAEHAQNLKISDTKVVRISEASREERSETYAFRTVCRRKTLRVLEYGFCWGLFAANAQVLENDDSRATVRAYPRCGHSFGVADASGFVLVGGPVRIPLDV